jgi:hypothetical protein
MEIANAGVPGAGGLSASPLRVLSELYRAVSNESGAPNRTDFLLVSRRSGDAIVDSL